MQDTMGGFTQKNRGRFSSVRSKILAMVTVAAVLPMIISITATRNGTGNIGRATNETMNQSVNERVISLNKVIADLCHLTNDAVVMSVESGLKNASLLLQARGGAGFSGETVAWTAVNQFTKEALDVRLPKMSIGGRWLGQVKSFGEAVPFVDEVKGISGGVCTVFQRINAKGDMIRVATNVKLKNGDRAIGTYIPVDHPDGKKNPVLDAVLNGKTYLGRAVVVDRWFTTGYEPIRGAGGQVVGMIFFGIDPEAALDVRKAIMEKTIGKGGYVAIIGGTGDQKHRYIISKGGSRDGEDIGGVKDTKGRFVIQEMVAKGLSQNEGEVSLYNYDWKNADDPAPREKVVAISYFKPWDWVILSSAYFDELNESNKLIFNETKKVTLWNMLFGLVSLGVVLVFVVWYTSTITEPLKRMVTAAEHIALGDVQQEITDHSNDEIGRLADAFRSMMVYLKNLAKDVRAMGQGDVSAVVTPKSDKDELSKNLAFALGQVGGLIHELNEVNGAVLVGNLSKRGDPEKFQGGYREIIQGVNINLDSVIKPVMDAAAVLERVAQKDLTARVTGAYFGDHAKIKDAVNLAAETLDESLQQVAVGADQIASASGQIGTGAQSLAQGTSQQASSLEEVSSSLQEMTAMTRQNSANAKEARAIAEATKTSAENGVGSMQRLSSAMDLIKKSSDDTAKIIKTIDEIAFQTNLLALNAAVEAARAGEAGKGFAVVAEEVRNLAMRSAEAAKNTADMIEGSVKNSENGVAINQEVMKNLEEINGHAKRVSEVMAEIAAASDQQSQGVGQVNTAMEQMNQLTQQNAANSEESASASEELSAQAQEMRAMVAGFKISGSHSAPSSRTAKTASASSLKPVLTKVVSKNTGKAEEAFPLDSGANGKDAFKDF